VTPNFWFEDFTEKSYSETLDLTRKHWRFVGFGETCEEPHVLWRHDMDISPQRALKAAEIEHGMGLKATYFLLVHSPFYNLFEPSVRDIVRSIRALGHDFGLHFDVSFHENNADIESLERNVAGEMTMVSDYTETKLTSISFHNPTDHTLATFNQDRICGLVSAYGRTLRERYRYVSDSNGYWRFSRLKDVLTARADPLLHVLTHAEWWTPEAQSPRSRVVRAVEGRAARVLADYDVFLEKHGRLNVRSQPA
jgi:hypothetical protein